VRWKLAVCLGFGRRVSSAAFFDSQVGQREFEF
jgi:hypothetical protein